VKCCPHHAPIPQRMRRCAVPEASLRIANRYFRMTEKLESGVSPGLSSRLRGFLKA